MKDLMSASLLLYLLILSSSDTVTVRPSSESKKVEWPEATNKVAVIVKCPKHVAKINIFMPEGTTQGSVILRDRNREIIAIYCKNAGRKNYYQGEIWRYPSGSSGPCKGNMGSTDTLIVEWTQEGVKLMRDEEIIFSRTWTPTDGNCLEKTGFWSLKNYGSSVISAAIVLGTRSYLNVKI